MLLRIRLTLDLYLRSGEKVARTTENLTYKAPSKKIPLTMIFCFVGKLSFHTSGTGMARMTTSMMVSEIAPV